MARMTMLLACLVLAACTSENDAERALRAEGFTDIQYTGYSWFACSKDDFYHSGFRAKNREGKTVEGVVCSGLVFKNATIRY